MIHSRVARLSAFLAVSAASIPAFGQAVVSTHSGVVYFFEGTAYIGDQPLEQKFGRFPDIGEGRELRTEHGRAEVLLTPGVFLRIGDNSAIRMLSNKFSDTRVELLAGSAILEGNEPTADTSVILIYKDWHVRLRMEGVCRIDSDPPKVSVYRGYADVSAGGHTEPVAVWQRQTLPLASVLVPDESAAGTGDAFKDWAMSRSQAISSDNAIAADIMDDPSAIEKSSGDALGLSYFPLTGIPGIATTNPYGLSFWSPFQSTLTSLYMPSYGLRSLYGGGWPITLRHYPVVLPSRSPMPLGLNGGRIGSPRGSYMPPSYRSPHPVVAPHAAPHPVPHPAPHPGGRR